ncbi:MAG: hypothetical protein H6632_10450 [Anaerolineales bacterium]|nr:hypothetical protein [Anaerolineales bacterium]
MRLSWDFCTTTIEKEQKVQLMPFLEEQDDRLAAHRPLQTTGQTDWADDHKARMFYRAIDLSG